ncbi:MAG: ABC transporter ATP-binding protein [Desulfovibrio sp.]|nr:ABC transporter ATP-binding protein [Desulfovibrio sp.]
MDKPVDLPVFDLLKVVKTRPGAERYRLEIPAFAVRRGEAIALVGPSGCGKSTALDLLSCALRPDHGERFVFAPAKEELRDVLACWENGGVNALAPVRMRYLGYVLQTGGLLPFLTARDNILLACKALGIVHERAEAVMEMARTLGIASLLGKYPAQLSVGERQRVAIARALAHRPTVVLADEPTAALDPAHSSLVMELVLQIARSEGVAVVMVSHDQEMARATGFKLVPMSIRSTDEGVVATLRHQASAARLQDRIQEAS